MLEFEKLFPAEVRKQASKIALREFEEERKNVFVVFAEEQQQSLDVYIEIDSRGNITDSSCECSAPEFCIHRIALMKEIFIRKSGKKKKRKNS